MWRVVAVQSKQTYGIRMTDYNIYIWQSCVEIEGYSVHISITLLCLMCRIAGLPLCGAHMCFAGANEYPMNVQSPACTRSSPLQMQQCV